MWITGLVHVCVGSKICLHGQFLIQYTTLFMILLTIDHRTIAETMDQLIVAVFFGMVMW